MGLDQNKAEVNVVNSGGIESQASIQGVGSSVNLNESVDSGLIELLRKIAVLPGDQQDITQHQIQCEEIRKNLCLAHQTILSFDDVKLEALSQEILVAALCTGAAKIISMSVQLQGLARMRLWDEASQVLGEMEVELQLVRARFPI